MNDVMKATYKIYSIRQILDVETDDIYYYLDDLRSPTGKFENVLHDMIGKGFKDGRISK